MKNLLFFLWMMFFPMIDDVARYIRCKTNQKQDDGEYSWYAGIFLLAIYFIVAKLLYEN